MPTRKVRKVVVTLELKTSMNLDVLRNAKNLMLSCIENKKSYHTYPVQSTAMVVQEVGKR